MNSLYKDYVEEIAAKIRNTFDLLYERNSEYRGKVNLNKASLIVGRHHTFADTTEVLGFKVLVTDNLMSYDYIIAIHDATPIEEEWLKIFHNDL